MYMRTFWCRFLCVFFYCINFVYIVFVVKYTMIVFFSHQELVAHCPLEQSCSDRAMRSNNQPLFPSPSEDKRYYIRAEVRKEIGSVDSTDSVLSIEWNRSSTPFQSKVNSTCKILSIFCSLTAKPTHMFYPSFLHKCL